MLKVLEGFVPRRPPFWFMRQAGRYLPEYRQTRSQVSDFLELCLTPSLATTATLQPVSRFHTDAAILFSDILVLPYAMGYPVRFTSQGPEVLPKPENAPKFPFPQFYERVSPVYEAIAKIKTKLPAEAALIGFAGAPWTVACYMIDGKNTYRNWINVKQYALSDLSRFRSFLDCLVESTIAYLSGQIDAGAEIIQLFDTWAHSVPAAYFAEWVIEPTRKIVTRLKRENPHIPIIGFIPGTSQWYQTYLSQTKVNALSLDAGVTPSWCRQNLALPLQGNLDPCYLLQGGDIMLFQARQIIQSFGGTPHIFNLSHGISPQTPPENLALLSQFLLDNASNGTLPPY